MESKWGIDRGEVRGQLPASQEGNVNGSGTGNLGNGEIDGDQSPNPKQR